MKTLKKLSEKSKLLSILILFFLVQSCHSQDNKAEKDIETIQKNAPTITNRITFSNNVDFKYAAKVATPGVVNIKCTFNPKIGNLKDNQNDFYNMPDPLKEFFREEPFFRQFKFQLPESEGYDNEPIIGSASGVILTPDGYIITNNHVIKNADEINVTLYDGKSYKAKVIGNDPLTDLALIKIDEDKLSFIMFGNSDTIEVGEWVVAVGNPFNLASTVTVGIVSAKARNINILNDQGAIESFIQTDAAVNPGNSGGALVNLEGKLIGINTAIATPSGVYAGYAFAIPVDVVKKVANDLMNYKTVQRGVLGISIRDLNSDLAKKINIERANGVYVDSVLVNGPANKAGVRSKDVIISIDGIETLTASKLQEIITRKRPGDQVKIKFIRNGNELKECTATLKKQGELPIFIKAENKTLFKDLGVELAVINNEDQKKYNLKNGLKVIKLTNGKLKKFTDIKVGFVITAVNKKTIYTIEDFIKAFDSQQDGIMLQGKYPNDPTFYYYAFGM